ncbi:MarR family transcriptional regulator [Virgisporangium ochraceum]|uniref:MarR family transcriptional regulator n=1 Tax=Virgisporangium ochraceum TaxID=65505 RepID=A0A8J3ZRE6_9ACTN|nr:MarR family transcriptional regulator [Virgisporangium ochraceum]GIJ67638.1 MarR family transcriptional regulator [Virgisporangium ochraceum]
MRKDVVDGIAAVWARELAAVSGLQFELSKRAARLSALFSERVNAELAKLGLTKAEYEILAVLRAAGAPYRLRPSDIGARLMLSSGGTSNLLRRLGEERLVEREADASDARSSWVRLSAEGVAVAEKAVLAASAAQQALLTRVPEERAEAANAALRDLLIALGDGA